MTAPVILEFDKLPNLPLQLGKGLLSRRSARPDVVVPPLEARVSDVRTSPEQLAAYRRVCGLPDDGALPPTWPQVLAVPVHAALLAHPSFPLPLPGLVHVSNVIEERRRIAPGEPLELRCAFAGTREARSGLEFDIRTTAAVDGELAWESVTTALVRMKGRGGGKREERRREGPGEPPGALRSVMWRVPEDMGRRYAKVAGDWNPIHVHKLLARPFGFPKAIVHGMWTFARCLGEGWDLLPPAPRRLEVSFRRPVLLPSSVGFSVHARDEGGVSFAVRGRDGASVHLSGSVSPLAI